MKNLLQGKDPQMLALAGCTIGNIFYGVSYMLTRIAQQSAPPAVQLSLRFLIAFVLVNLLVLSGKAKLQLKVPHLWHLPVTSLAAVAVFYTESLCVYYTNSSFASLVMAVLPVFCLIGAAIFLKEYPSRRQVIYSFFPIVGVIFITLANNQMGVVDLIGILVTLLCCVATIFSRLVGRKIAPEFTAFTRTYSLLFFGSICFTTTALISVKGDLSVFIYPLTQPSFLLSTLALCILCSLVAQTMVNYSYSVLPVVTISAINTISTVVGVVAGFVLLREPVNAMSLFGSVLTLYGIWQVSRPDKSKDPIPSATNSDE
ncbi:MAG: DMT family transporter [Ruminococcaceae bacterium]|nr:DMT family transporter [Oscillospiraceae bacterium]